MNAQFAEEVSEGLKSTPKYLPSKYLYDKIGDKLFQEIMHLEEYYLTNSEYEIFTMNKESFRQIFSEDVSTFQLIDFGAGDGLKTKILIEYLLETDTDFEYIPIDISSNVLELLEREFKAEFPSLKVRTMHSDYFEALKLLTQAGETRKVVLFLGSNIGNFSFTEAVDFIHEIGEHFNDHDFLILGTDLKKKPETILNAYNDKAGVTKAFNINLLNRINRELGGDFDTANFHHYPIYNPESGACQSYLVSDKHQKVTINKLNLEVVFEPYETIFMEVSQKYSTEDLMQIAKSAGFTIAHKFYDCKHYFLDSVWQLKA